MIQIYKITNKINNKLYIGKTAYSLQKRFAEHCKDCKRESLSKRPLYYAMRKYGVENFTIELLEECQDYEANIKESYWIQFYDTYKNGYNATLGGDGTCVYDHEAIAEFLKENPYTIKAIEHFGCSADIIRDIANKYNITLKPINTIINKEKSIDAYDKVSNTLIASFESTVEASKWCYDNKKCKTLNSGVRSHIADCANGKRKSAYGYIWKYK